MLCWESTVKMSAKFDSSTILILSTHLQCLNIELTKLGRKSMTCCAGKARGATVKMSAQLTLAHFDLISTSPTYLSVVGRICFYPANFARVTLANPNFCQRLKVTCKCFAQHRGKPTLPVRTNSLAV